MAFKIGFAVSGEYEDKKGKECKMPRQMTQPRRSLVQVYFAEKNRTLAYYNDKFDLHNGDIVYVDGKLEGCRGRVTDVNYNFKIKLSDYKRVIALADTVVHGEFFMAGSHLVTFERGVLPNSQIAAWFIPPLKPEDEIVCESDDSAFALQDLKDMKISQETACRGNEYYTQNRVRYISIDGGQGYAIVEGSKGYEVEFNYRNGEISGLVCSCFCSGQCKHEFAAMLQLRETLELIEKNYPKEYAQSDYFAAVAKQTLFAYAVDGKESGAFTI